jgi:hypothetical protein
MEPEIELEGELNDYIVTEIVFNSGRTIADIEAFLEKRKTTGKITVERSLSQGGSQTVKVTERTRLKDGEAEKVRSVLGWG